MNYKIDNLQYCNWSREIFEINREAELDAVHATIVYHEDFNELQKVMNSWDSHFKENSDLIFLGKITLTLKKQRKRKKQQYFLAFKTVLQLKMILI